jgi:transcriptional regulator with PAS, ATPase and Fis domain
MQDFSHILFSNSSKMNKLRTINTFQEYHWPGKIRKLENTVKRIILFSDQETALQDLFH